MPKKRKSDKVKSGSKAKGSKKLIIGGVIVVVIVVATFFFLNQREDQENEKEEQQLKAGKISIPPNSFNLMSVFYLNEKDYDRFSCDKDVFCQNLNGTLLKCLKVDQLTMRFRVSNLESLAFVSCEVNDKENKYTEQHFAFYPAGKIAELSIQNIAYDKGHVFETCCIYDDGEVRSDEFCLPTVQVQSLCP